MRTFLTSFAIFGSVASVWAATTIDPAKEYAHGSNLGWMNWYADGANGAVIGDYICAGNIYAANVGWISLGGGSPTNGIRYQNLAGNDFGVNQDGSGNLRGYAYGANIGWINFENTGAPTVDLKTGKLRGSVWSANCGWISLSNAVAYVRTDSFWPGVLDANGLPVAWELTYFGTTGIDPNADPDHDSMSNTQEYVAGTNPTNSADVLEITAFNTAPGGTTNLVTWTSVPTRFYYLQKTLSLSSPAWQDSGLGLISPDGASTMRGVADTNAPMRLYRVRAVRPLAP